MLPVKGTVRFWKHNREGDFNETELLDNSFAKELADRAITLECGIENGRIILPLYVEGGINAVALVEGVDPGLLGKMAPDWLAEFRDSLQVRLEERKKDFVDPVTGLYNARALSLFFDQSAENDNDKVLFLICSKKKSRRVTDQLPQVKNIGGFIDATNPEPLFYLGGNVFGLLLDDVNRQKTLKTAHWLLQRLKKEGVQSAHIGISINDAEKKTGVSSVLQECWQALMAAERRGTFSFCEGSYLKNKEQHPFALPEKHVISYLRRKWRARKQFALLCFCAENIPAEIHVKNSFAKIFKEILPKECFFVFESDLEGYILIFDLNAEQVLDLVGKVKQEIEKKYKKISVGFGISHWPLLNYNKTQTIVNCRKAIMHGRFLGEGTITKFDHVSLNVSGDYYYDEGDYRKAVSDYKLGVKLAPEDINLLNSLGVALTALNKLRDAVGYFERVLQIDANDFMALVNMGFARRILGDNDLAISCFEKAALQKEFAESSVFEELSLQLARLYADQGRPADALVVLEKLDQKKNIHQKYTQWQMKGEVNAALGNYKEAIKYQQRVLQINPQDADALSLLGELYALDGQGDDIALSLCKKAVEIDDSSWKNWYRIALVQYKMELLDHACVAVQECLRMNRKSVNALTLAEKIFKKSGELRKSKNMRNRLLKVVQSDHENVNTMPN